MPYKDPKDPRALVNQRKYDQLHREQKRQRRTENRARLKAHVNKVKDEGSCVDCGSSYPGEPWLMDFDHVRGEKRYNIGSIIVRDSWRLLLEELDKCELVCVLCHRRRTAKRAGWVPNKYDPQ